MTFFNIIMMLIPEVVFLPPHTFILLFACCLTSLYLPHSFSNVSHFSVLVLIIHSSFEIIHALHVVNYIVV